LPVSWKDGSVKGLVARGNIITDISWKNNQLSEAVLKPAFDGYIEVAGEVLNVMCNEKPVQTEKTKIGFKFPASGGKEYKLAQYK